MECDKKKDGPILKTVIATVLLLLFFFMQGTVARVNNITGAESAFVRGSVIWCLVIITLTYFGIRYGSLSGVGFRKPKQGSARKLLYFIPLFVVALLHFVTGLSLSRGVGLIVAYLYFSLSVGVAEEIYFRGIICNMWLEKGLMKAMLVSSILFGLCHLLNLVTGSNLSKTIPQICFALAYGLVFAMIFYVGKSVIVCMLLHAFHDLCSFISGSGTKQLNIILGAVQFMILVAYFIYLYRNNGYSDLQEESNDKGITDD